MRPQLDWPIWIGIDCENVEAQNAYYRNVVGLEQTSKNAFGFGNGCSLELNEVSPGSPKGYSVAYRYPGPTLDSFRAACELLISRGAQLEGTLQCYPDYAWGTFIDPEKNRYVVKWIKPA